MSVNTSSPDNPLERAAIQLREACRDHSHLTSPFDAGSLARMLVHIGNINHSVLASTRDHLNASKRLHDFAATLGRIARHFASQDPQFAERMQSIAKTLDEAGEELVGSDVVPAWPAAEIRH